MVERTSLKGFETGYNSFYKCHGRKPVGIYYSFLLKICRLTGQIDF